MERPCVRAVDRQLRTAQNSSAPCKERKQPDTFCLTFIMRRSRSARLLSKGTAKLRMKCSTAWRSRSRRLRSRRAGASATRRLPGRVGWGRMSGKASLNEGAVLGHQGLGEGVVERLCTAQACRFDRCFRLEQQRFHVLCPRLLVLLVQEGQFAQQMRAAQGVTTLAVGGIGTPAVVNQFPTEARHQVQRIECYSSPFGMDAVAGQSGCVFSSAISALNRSIICCCSRIRARSSASRSLFMPNFIAHFFPFGYIP